MERAEEEKGIHVAERNDFRPFDSTVGGSRSKVVRESCGGDALSAGKEE